MKLLPVTSTLIAPELLTQVAERWRKHCCAPTGTHTSVAAGIAVRSLLEGGAAGRIKIAYRQTAEPPGVEVWVYRAENASGKLIADPLDAILAVGFAKWQGPHTVRVRSRKFFEVDGKRFYLYEKRTAGDAYDLRRGLTVAFGRAIRQALDALIEPQTLGLESLPLTSTFASHVSG
jgi:hypothetical protein